MYYDQSINEVIESLNSRKNGLSTKESNARLNRFGSNTIIQTHTISPFKILIQQFTSFVILILIAAIIISLLIGETLDAAVIAIIVIVNGIFGFTQEYRAEKAIEALKKLSALKARVLREGKEIEIDASELVPGDIIVLRTGDKIPADARLIEQSNLQINESSLTGESTPVTKTAIKLSEDAILAERKNMLYSSTIITRGKALAIVTNTGMSTEIGKIAKGIQQSDEEKTPLQIKLQHFGKWLGWITIAICILVFLLGIGREWIFGTLSEEFIVTMFLASVSLAVAAIPEGLPAIVTISLALGVQRMVKRHALIRRLPAVETLGSTSYICTDKTGTLTRNEMTVTKLFLDNNLVNVSGGGYEPTGEFTDFKTSKPIAPNKIDLLLRIGALCNESSLFKEKNAWKVNGDPTEAALLVSASKAKLGRELLLRKYPQKDDIPFDSKRKCMTTIHKVGSKLVAYSKGAPDIILQDCSKILINGKVRALTAKDKQLIEKTNQELSKQALRVLGFAYKELPAKYTKSKVEQDLIFVGLQGMMDPPRQEVKQAIDECYSAGIKTVMITGDFKDTAIAIAKHVGLMRDKEKVLTGKELDELSDEEFKEIVEDVVVYARTSPEHKARILAALKSRGHVVAMTGDGVNDAPALKKADIGVAMGITGTDVAKEASDMVLTDDNFVSIVNAVEEGRGIYNNIKSFVRYTLSSNLGEILVIFLAILVGLPLPLIAIQILWVNLVTDGLPGLALGLDPYDKNIMSKKPRKLSEPIITREVINNVLIVGTVMCIGTLGLFYYYGAAGTKARSIAFTTLILFQLFNVLTYRAKNFLINIKDSKYLIGAVVVSIIMQIVVLYTPLSNAFKTTALGLSDWVLITLVASSIYIILEVRKLILRKISV